MTLSLFCKLSMPLSPLKFIWSDLIWFSFMAFCSCVVFIRRGLERIGFARAFNGLCNPKAEP